MKRRIRGRVVVMCLLLAALGLPACSGGTSGASGRTTLVVWHQESPPNRVQAWQAIIDKFNSSQSTVHVVQQVKDWNTIYTVAPAAIKSGTGPDVLMVMPELSTY